MILLDTNIVSEMMKSTPEKKVIYWIDQQEATQLYISTITIAEIVYGINALPVGNRRSLIDGAFNKTIKIAFKHRVLIFDENAALWYGKLMAHRKQLGRPLSILDGQIASIARAQDAVLATRNIRDFSGCEIELINPFK